MPKRSKTPKASAGGSGSAGRPLKNLPLLTFEEFVDATLHKLATTLPSKFSPDDLADTVCTYLVLSMNTIRLGKHKIQAIDIEKYYDLRKYPILDEESDFKRAIDRMFSEGSLWIIHPPMQAMRKRATELTISWREAASIIRKSADRRRLDGQPVAIKRGEFSEQIIEQLKRIRHDHVRFKTFEELEAIYPNYEVLRTLKTSPFDSDDRELLASPRRWGNVVTYATGILSRYFKKSIHTITRDRKQFKSSMRMAPRK